MQQCNKTYIPLDSTTEKQPDTVMGLFPHTQIHKMEDVKLWILPIIHCKGAISLLPGPQSLTIHSIKSLASVAAMLPHRKCDLFLMQLEG